MYVTKGKKPICKITYCMIPTLWYSLKGKTMEAVKTSVFAKNGGERNY